MFRRLSLRLSTSSPYLAASPLMTDYDQVFTGVPRGMQPSLRTNRDVRRLRPTQLTKFVDEATLVRRAKRRECGLSVNGGQWPLKPVEQMLREAAARESKVGALTKENDLDGSK